MLRLIAYVLLLGLLVASPWLYEEIVGFNPDSIKYEGIENLSKDVKKVPFDERSPVLDSILNQDFYWLGQGHQVYAFVSADQKYVLKLFKFNRLRKPGWIPYMMEVPFFGDYFAHQERKRQHRLEKLFNGYQLAYEKDRGHTGLVYVHLNPTQPINREINVHDRVGLSHVVNLNEKVFAVQVKANTTRNVLIVLLKNHEIETVKRRIRQLFDMYVDEYRLGIIDQDHNILSNTGFIGNDPIRLDIGQLQYDKTIMEPSHYKKDLNKIVYKRLYPWLSRHYPTYSKELLQDMEAYLSSLPSN